MRADHRPDSDVDVRLFLKEWRNLTAVDMEWWGEQNETDFAALKSLLPGPLSLHREQTDDADTAIRSGRLNPVLIINRVVSVWTPGQVGLSRAGQSAPSQGSPLVRT